MSGLRGGPLSGFGGMEKERLGQRFAKEVGMGDPAEENDPPPESGRLFPKASEQVNKKCDRNVTKTDWTYSLDAKALPCAGFSFLRWYP